MTEKTKESGLALETLPGGIPDLTKPATAARFAEIISAGSLDKMTPGQQSTFLAGLGAYIGIKPELGDLMIYMGKPYITISGYRRIAHNTGLLNGLTVEPASDRDRLRFGAKEGEHLWISHVHKKGSTRPYTGWGYVRLADRNPVSKSHPQEMARKRAVYDGLRLAFPPSEAIGDIHMKYIAEAEEESARAHVVNRLTESNYGEEAVGEEIVGEGVASVQDDLDSLR